VDILICRELTGGIYFGKKERSADNNSAEDVCTYSRLEIARIAHFAFRQSMERKKKVMLVDKANVLETSRLWRDEVKQIHQKDYPEVQLDFMYVDNAAMQLILNPAQFDVILTENMFGDILSDEASVLTGSLGLLPSSSIGAGTPLFEPVHGSYPQAAGKNSANPVASILSAAMMLEYFGMKKEAKDVYDAVNWSISNTFCTADIVKHNPLTCSLVGDFISIKIEEGASFNVKKEDCYFDYGIV
jgi:3-isopropylmalate dehydrogenase